MDELRSARTAEYQAVLDHLDTSYGFEPGTFRSFTSRWDEPYFDPDRTYLILAEGRIASLVRVFPLTLELAGARLLVGGVGSVSTAPWARGRGYMARLMDHATEQMRAEGMAVSILWGDRHRYNSFGYETAGHSIQLTVGRRGLERSGVAVAEAELWDGDATTVAAIREAYQSQPYRKVRADSEYLCHFSGADCRVYTTASPFAYLVVHRGSGQERVVEFGGHQDGLLGLLRARLEAGAASSFSLPYPAHHAVPPRLLAAASSYSVIPAGMIRVNDLDLALEQFAGQAAEAPVPSRANLAALPAADQASRLFGTLTPSPYRLWVWPLDHV